MPTWQIFLGAGNTYRWVNSDQSPTNDFKPRKSPIHHENPNPRLPSMEDLLIQESSKLFQNCGGIYDGKAPMFRTGSGKAVEVKSSSVPRALSVLGESDVDDRASSNPCQNGGSGRDKNIPMFRTGSGKAVEVKQSSVAKALSIIGETDVTDRASSIPSQNGGSARIGNIPMFQTGSGKTIDVKKASITKALSVLGETDVSDRASSNHSQNGGSVHDGDIPMFRTGSGKSVKVKHSSVMKAFSVLGEDNVGDRGSSKLIQSSVGGPQEKSSMFRTGLGKSVEVKQSSIMKALSVLGEDDVVNRGHMHATNNGHVFSNSLFQTGSGKMVNLSSAGISRAKTLLGLEESSDQFISEESNGWENSMNLKKRGRMDINQTKGFRSISRYPVTGQTDMDAVECESKEFLPNVRSSEVCNSAAIPPPVKFQTAGGRSISVSNDALQRAMSLLGDSAFGDLPNKGSAVDTQSPFLEQKSFSGILLNKENGLGTSCLHHEPTLKKFTSKSFLPPKASISKENQGSTSFETDHSGSNFLKKNIENDSAYEKLQRLDSIMSDKVNPLSSVLVNPNLHVENSLAKNVGPRKSFPGRSHGGSLVDISNSIGIAYAEQKQIPRDKRRLGRSSVSPFKKPRNSRFSTPLTSNISLPLNSSSTLTSEETCSKENIFARYPFKVARATVRDFFGGPPCHTNQLEHVPPEVRCMNAEMAETYMFLDASHLDSFGADGFRHMLAQSGASMHWVANHYKWIVWKLACYERGYPAKTVGKYLTVSNVLEELKYRYEREVNHAHRSALKRILEGDASPASMVVLCISAIRISSDKSLEIEQAMSPYGDTSKSNASKTSGNSNATKIELTDGWYAIDAILDVPLSKQLVAGKLFVGQKIRIWRAGLCGWVGPISPLETSKTANLQLHINGTYRAHWADQLGFCKGPGAPLAFSCIKSGGGLVPQTLVGVTRIYPILYKERLKDGGSIVRSERMERKMMHVYNQKRSTIAEGIMCESQKDTSSFHCKNESDIDEGAKLLNILEKSAEPEMIMAEMSTEQLTSFANYQAKQEVIRQLDMDKKIEKAIEDAGLSERHVTPFLRVRVVGLTSIHSPSQGQARKGLITIWNPTEKQQRELVEGQAYVVAGLVPLNSDSETIFLHARGSTTTWKSLPPPTVANFVPFFTPRKPVFLSNMGEVPLASEFDIAAVIVYVGEVYLSGYQKKQWVFVTDGSIPVSDPESKELSNCMLAISFCAPTVDDSFTPISYTLAGSTIGFFNLVKRTSDTVNHIWVAEATDNSTYSFRYDISGYSHLREAAGSACKWAKISSLAIQKLKEKTLFIIGNHKS